MVDGSLLQWGEKNSNNGLRLEFNPNKCMKECIHELLPHIGNKHVTRIDIALDYIGTEISEYLWLPDRKRKRRIFCGKDGKLETVQFGSRASDKRYRIYDKAREQEEPEKAP